VTGMGLTGLDTGGGHACGIGTGGTVLCWGANANGQLGDGTRIDRADPTPVLGVSGAKQVATGGDHSCALLGDGSVACWGLNTYGQLADATRTSRSVVAPVKNLTGAVTAIAAGDAHTSA